MNKVISFSLWGDNPIYTIGTIKNVKLAKDIYPDWVCWIYVGTSTPIEIIKELKSFDNTKVIEMEEFGDWASMFWRFYPASDSNVDILIVRDSDSRLNMREKEAVDEWINSSKGFHIMRDHPAHRTEILGGMWGVKKNIIPDMKYMIDLYIKGNFWQVDQNFLREHVFHKIKNNCFVHDEFFEMKKFPSERKGKFFVGQAFDQYDNILYPKHISHL